MPPKPHMPPARCSVPVTLLRADEGMLEAREDQLAVEEPLEIRLSYVNSAGIAVVRPVSITMRTPGADEDLAIGFLFGEGLLAGRDQVESVGPIQGQAGSSVEVRLRRGVPVDLGLLDRHFYTTSSCGVCGKSSIQALSRRVPPLEPEPALRAELEVLAKLPALLREGQPTFDATGGLHAAGLFSIEGRPIAIGEDVGRHNAVDKVIGRQVREGAVPLRRAALVLSGRASFELIQKALVAGIPFVVAVGAPSSLAVELARSGGLTLLGFARGGRVNVYSGAERLAPLESVPQEA